MTGATGPELAEANVAVYRLQLETGPGDAPESLGADDREWIDPLLQQNAVWFCQLRWLVVVFLGSAGLVSVAGPRIGILALTGAPIWPLSAALILTILNLAFIRAARSAAPGRGVAVRTLLWGQIVSDLFVLTGVIHWLGHSLPAAPFMYLFHIILACIVFTPMESLAVTGLAAAFYVLCLLLESAGLLERSTLFPGNPQASAGAAPPQFSVLFMFMVWAVIWYLASRLSKAVRSRDRELFISNRRLAASIEERSRHMLQTTHQLKAPFAAIHAQTQLLLGEYCGSLPPKARATVEKISARCLVLARQIQEMLQLANLRSLGQTAPPKQRINVGTLIEEILSRVEPAARQRGVRFEKEIQPAVTEGVADHLTMLIDNLVTNAVNYSFENGIVNVACLGRRSGDILVSVRDRGIGISKEKLPRIFDDYYRTEEAVRHNSGSTGLGLAIVRQVACKDGVPITVESAPGWGTRFTVELAGASAGHPTTALNANN